MDRPQRPTVARRARLAVVVGLAVALATATVGVGPAPAGWAQGASDAVLVGVSTVAAQPVPGPSGQPDLVSDPVGPDVPAWSYALVAVLVALVLTLVGRSRSSRRVSGGGRREG